MKKKLLVLISFIFLSSSLLTACTENDLNGNNENQSDKTDSVQVEEGKKKKEIKSTLEKILNIKIPQSEKELQAYKSKIISYIHTGDRESLREEAQLIKDEYKDNEEMWDLYTLLYYRSVMEGNVGSEDYPLPEEEIQVKVFLEKEDIQDQAITDALIDIGLITDVKEEDLQEVRYEVVRLIRGNEETQEELYKYQDVIMAKPESMNPVNASAYLQVYGAATKEAFHGSKTFPHPEGH